jgi:hypothetical protein
LAPQEGVEIGWRTMIQAPKLEPRIVRYELSGYEMGGNQTVPPE